jgi:hypothetical protein
MQSYYTFIALDLARERAAEAQRYRLAALAHPHDPSQVGLVRRSIARLAVAVARAADNRLVQRELAIH